MKLPIVALVTVLTLAGCGQTNSLTVQDAWVRLPAVQGRPAAAYFDIRTGAEAKTLLAVKTPAAIRSELHESMKGSGGVMSMKALPQLAIPASSSVAFAPGGKHVMLYDLSPMLKAGDTTRLTLSFADGTSVDTEAKVIAAGDPAPVAH